MVGWGRLEVVYNSLIMRMVALYYKSTIIIDRPNVTVFKLIFIKQLIGLPAKPVGV